MAHQLYSAVEAGLLLKVPHAEGTFVVAVQLLQRLAEERLRTLDCGYVPEQWVKRRQGRREVVAEQGRRERGERGEKGENREEGGGEESGRKRRRR